MRRIFAKNLHKIEAGLKAHPNFKQLEEVTFELGRLDLLCIDSKQRTTIIELPPAEDIDALEEDAQEEDLTEAVVEPQYEEDDSADAHEVAEQIALDEPDDEPAAT